MGSWHLRLLNFATAGTGLASNRCNCRKLATWRFRALIIYNGSHLTSPIPSGSKLTSLYRAPQPELAFQQTTPVAPQYPFNTVVTWHSGMWLHKYAPYVKNCDGCGSSFADKYRSSPHNFVVNHVDRRITGKNDYTGKSLYGRDFSTHITTSKNPEYPGSVYISTALYLSGLNEEQRVLLQSCDLDLLFH
ncbi:unnamed protein product [Pocillopora meandrina]|uniref:C2H2-type domain-containing protein n=1 Tax=Pocillopora meandrina TaxID=46732 RepID=A0AAU9WH48_9CNID|nr:unnamed protein product [Pocillopora meandrina]